MAIRIGYQSILTLYESAWRLAIPLLRFNQRIKEGFDTRRSATHLLPADIWIQAASAGEAYLACSLMEQLRPDQPIKILVTSNTRQGMDIINQGISDIAGKNPSISASSSYFPFDCPSIMNTAVKKINPRLMILLETEIWPGLLAALKKSNSRTFIINGRLTPKSLNRYMLMHSFFRALSPDAILSISEQDAVRFKTIFDSASIEVMHNIKFDRLKTAKGFEDTNLRKLISGTAPFLVLGSVRQEEEDFVNLIIKDIRFNLPDCVIGLFPRHMHRISYWTDALNKAGFKWRLRSVINESTAEKGTIVLWDTFGELGKAYALADAVFVGGSLAPLGGQNFLEPLIYGIQPVIGPYWDNFAWVGDDIFSQGLVIKADNWQKVSAELIHQMKNPVSKDSICDSALRYIKNRSGGTRQACALIEQELKLSYQ